MSYRYTRQSPYLGAIMFFLSKKKFIEMAVLHGMACNLESVDQSKRVQERGDELLNKWEETYRTDYTKMTVAIDAALWSAFWTIVGVVVLSLVIAAMLERVSLSLPIDYAK